MGDAVVDSLILDLLEWLATRDRSYEEVMDAWRTSCPKLPVWEDANDRGLVTTEQAQGRRIVRITPSGLALLQQRKQGKPESSCVI
jgi:DNA-binding PadR family transcriptional regulator